MFSGEASENPPRRASRRRLWWMLGTVAVFFVAALAVVFCSDAEPPDTSDLAVLPLDIPEAENFYSQLMKLEERLRRTDTLPEWEPDDLPADSPDRMPAYNSSENVYDDFADFLAAGKGWTPARLARWDALLAGMAVECEALVALTRSQALLPTNARSGSDVPYRVGSRLCAAAGLYWQAGETQRALKLFEVAYEIGERLKASRGPLSIYEAGMDLNRQAIRNFDRLVAQEPALAPDLFRWWQSKRGRESTGSLADALRTEYRFFSLNLDPPYFGMEPGEPVPNVFSFCYKTRVLVPLVLKPNLTKALYAEFLRSTIKWRDLPSSEIRLRGGFDSDFLRPADLFQPVNLYGRYIVHESRHPLFVIWRRAHYRSEVSVVETALALRLYHAEQGRLPVSLDELVPAYFPSIPLDYADGAPIRYSRDARAVWSVGERALHILAPDQAIDRREIYRLLDFAEPPAVRTKAAEPSPDLFNGAPWTRG